MMENKYVTILVVIIIYNDIEIQKHKNDTQENV